MSSSGYAGALVVCFALVTPLAAKDDSSGKSSESSRLPPAGGGRTLDDWVRQLTDLDPSKREEAIKAIVLFGPETKPHILKLLHRLEDKDAGCRINTVFAMRMLREYIDKKDIPKVVEALALHATRLPHSRKGSRGEGQAIVRYEAVMTLAQFGDDAHPAMWALAEGAQDPATYQMRLRCVQLLRHLGRKPETGADEGAISALVQVLRYEPTLAVRKEAVMGLGALGRPKDQRLLRSEKAILETISRGQNLVLATWAYISLIALDDKDIDKLLKPVVKLLKYKSVRRGRLARRYQLEVRVNAAQALGAAHEKAEKYADALIELTRDKELETVIAAFSALEIIFERKTRGLVHPKAQIALDAAAAFLKHEKLPMRIQAAQFLASLGPKAKGTVPDLIKALQDDSPLMVAAAIYALGMTRDTSSQTFDALIKTLDRKETNILSMTCMAFLQIGEPAPPVIKALVELSLRKDLPPETKTLVLDTIKRLQEPKKPVKAAAKD